MLDLQTTVDSWLSLGKRIALATVVRTWGSSPRQPGAHMAVNENGQISGSVSGGCVEGAVVQEALDCLQDLRPRRLTFGVSDEQAWEVGLSCGGRLEVFVEVLDSQWWKSVAQTLADHTGHASATVLDGCAAGARVTTSRNRVIFSSPGLDEGLTATLEEAARQAWERRRTGYQNPGGLELFCHCQLSQPRLIMIGGAHVGIYLQRLARALGFRVFLIDPRRSFATRDRFPEVEEILHEYPDQALPRLNPGPDTYLTVLTHDPKIDDPALRTALPLGLPYLGVLSSRRTHRKRVKRLREAGLSEALLQQIRTPIGLDIGAKTPEEIALAILAEIVAIRRGKG